ncbi:MAG: 5-oxoprolinase subunit PxpB [Opitutus sp.]
MTLAPLGDSAVVVTLGNAIDETTLLRVRSLVAELERVKSPGIIDIVPAYATVTVFYEIVPAGATPEPPYQRVCRIVEEALAKIEHRWPDLLRANLESSQSRDAQSVVRIPVCYGGEYGPDLEEVARHCKLTRDEVVSIHSEGKYGVYAIGFSPGFPYLGGLSPKLHTPRRESPRTMVPAGSVGIGGQQTGIYPLSSPGGWQLIGRTPKPLLQLASENPALLRVGDRVQFFQITPEEFSTWK